MQLTRQQRRQIDRLGEKVDRVTDGDRLFFERRKDRSHRLRRASYAEIETNEAACGSGSQILSPGFAWFAAVRQIAPGFRMRAFVVALADSNEDQSDDVCRTIYENHAPPGAAEIEAKLRLVAKASGNAG